MRSEDEKKRVLESCHSGVGGMYGIKMLISTLPSVHNILLVRTLKFMNIQL